MSKMVAPLEVGVCCSDLDRLVSFYVDILSARLIATNDVSAEKAREAAVGASGFRVTRIELPTGERLKFLQPETPPKIEERSGVILQKQNTSYLTFIVDDMASIVGRLEAAGAKLLSGAQPVDIRPGVSILLALDPEQNLIEFVRYADLSAYRPELAVQS
jgi:lactoylglutathione lyase